MVLQWVNPPLLTMEGMQSMGDLIRPHNRWSPSYDEQSPFLVGKSQWLVTNLQEMNRKATTLKQYMSILDNINMVYIYISYKWWIII